jgi:hypothetical protein
MFQKMPFILQGVIALTWAASFWMPTSLKSIFYALSLSLKSVIIFILPFLIFALLFNTAVQLARKATKVILFILLAICASNFLSTLISYPVGRFAFHCDFSMVMPQGELRLLPSWSFSLPKWIGNEHALFAGLGLGLLCAFLKLSWTEKIASQLEKSVNRVLKLLLYSLPFFVAGFIIKLSHDNLLKFIVKDYTFIFALVTGSVFCYIFFIYWVANRFCYRAFVQSLKNMLPATLAGFGSMSSAAAMPLTLLATEKNASNPTFARALIPATVNVHLIGDCFAIPIFAFAVLKSFGMPEPAFFTYLIFASYFVLAKFSVAAIPGGGILIMLPILDTYLGFNAEMLSLITALYILFDPVITSANVLGNGGFAMNMSRVLKQEKRGRENAQRTRQHG